ncbi:MAG: hydantoinase/oxoprolinase family protein, partial [bacterium]|nr:hydantoinase/oxoprolinase family protein [bacterium]
LARAGVAEDDIELELAVDARHKGQGEAVTVPLGSELGAHPAPQVDEAFEKAYVQLYGRRPPGVQTELLTWRLRVAGPRPEVDQTAGQAGEARPETRRPIWSAEDGGFVEARVVDRYGLAPGQVVEGPAVIEERESTAIVGPGGRARLDGHGNLIVTVTEGG